MTATPTTSRTRTPADGESMRKAQERAERPLAGAKGPRESAAPRASGERVSVKEPDPAEARAKRTAADDADDLEAFGQATGEKTQDDDERDERPMTKREYRKGHARTPPGSKPHADAGEDPDEELEQDDSRETDDEPDPDAEEEESDDAEEEEDDDAAYNAAMDVLKLDGWTAADLKNLSKARIIARAEQIQKRQRDVARQLQQNAEAKKSESAKSGSSAESGDGSGNGSATPKGLRLDPKRLKEAFDDEGAAAIAGSFDEAFARAEGDLETWKKGIEEKFADSFREVVRENFRMRLQRRRPELAEILDDDRTWGRVSKRIEALKEIDGESRRTADEIADEAIAAVLKGQKVKSQQSLRDQSRSAATAGAQRRAPPKERTSDDVDADAFDTSMNGDLTQSARQRKLREISHGTRA